MTSHFFIIYDAEVMKHYASLVIRDCYMLYPAHVLIIQIVSVLRLKFFFLQLRESKSNPITPESHQASDVMFVNAQIQFLLEVVFSNAYPNP